jgi:hypothetical protein
MDSIIGLCSRAIWLDKGGIRLDGQPERVVTEYLGIGATVGLFSDLRGAEFRDGVGEARLLDIAVAGEDGAAPTCGRGLYFKVRWISLRPIQGAWVVRITIRDQFDRKIATLDNELSGNFFNEKDQLVEARCEVMRMPIVAATYYADVSLWAGRVRQDRVERALSFEVLPGDFFGSGVPMTAGVVCIDHSWSFKVGAE